MTDLEQAKHALMAIPSNLPRDPWHEVGRAAIAAGIDLDTIVDWSRSAPNFKSEQDVRSAFRTITQDGGTGPGTLFAIAKQHGWRAANRPAAAPHRPQERVKSTAQGLTPAQVFERAEAATNEHPYIGAKRAAGVPLEKLRVLPAGDPLRIAGQCMAGALVVPAYGADCELQSLQLIPAPGAGKKMNLPGAPMAGASFTVGDPVPGGVVHVCEGIGAAWACWQATGRATVVAFGWGNVSRVAAQLRQRDPAAQLVIVPDVGKEDEAKKIAGELACHWVEMPAGWPQNADVNDLAQRDGHDVLAALLDAPKAVTVTTPAPPFNLVPIADLLHVKPEAPCYVWEGLAPVAEVMLWAAHGGVGKSTIALMLGVATGTGRPLFGIPTRKSKVCFFSAEDGAAVVRHRLHFVCGAMGVDMRELDGELFILDATAGDPALFAEVTVAGRREGETTRTYSALREFVKQHSIGLLIVDNASDTFDASEIERSKVRGFMRALANLARECEMAVILLAHVDKGTSRGERAGTEGYSGSTAWNNSARSRLFMSRSSDGGLLIEHQKHNLGPLHEPIRLTWATGGVPQVDEPFGPVVQAIADRGHEKALLKLIAEFTARGEPVTTATTSRTHAGKLLRQESTFPRIKDAELFDVLRGAERAGRLERATYRGTDRKPRECWHVTDAGRQFAGLAATAATAATTDATALGAVPAEPAATAATSPPGGMGEERAQQRASAEAVE